MKFPQRIVQIAEFVNHNFVLDVGADHGLLEKYLIINKQGVEITAVENKKGPYSYLINNLSGLKNVRFSFTSGLKALDSFTETVVLAGMGGMNIVNILHEYPQKVKRLKQIIVDAHSDIDVVRKTVVEYGFEIEEERIVHECNKYYVIINFVKSSKDIKYSDEVIEFGKINKNDPLRKPYLMYLLDHYKKVYDVVSKIESQKKQSELLKSKIERLEKYYAEN